MREFPENMATCKLVFLEKIGEESSRDQIDKNHRQSSQYNPIINQGLDPILIIVEQASNDNVKKCIGNIGWSAKAKRT